MTGLPTFTYPQVGATQRRPLPAGYRHLTYRQRLGVAVLPSAAEALLTWRMHRALGLRFEVAAPRAVPGVRVSSRIGLGPVAIAAPCQVVWTVAEEDRAGFAYGTLPGHPAQGEESFVVNQDGDGVVWFTITSFSRPARWYAAAAGPLVPVLQQAYARRCGQVLRRFC